MITEEEYERYGITGIITRLGFKLEHRQIIDEYASKGYRYVGYIPTEIRDQGTIISLIIMIVSSCAGLVVGGLLNNDIPLAYSISGVEFSIGYFVFRAILVKSIALSEKAIKENKWMIHFGL